MGSAGRRVSRVFGGRRRGHPRSVLESRQRFRPLAVAPRRECVPNHWYPPAERRPGCGRVGVHRGRCRHRRPGHAVRAGRFQLCRRRARSADELRGEHEGDRPAREAGRAGGQGRRRHRGLVVQPDRCSGRAVDQPGLPHGCEEGPQRPRGPVGRRHPDRGGQRGPGRIGCCQADHDQEPDGGRCHAGRGSARIRAMGHAADQGRPGAQRHRRVPPGAGRDQRQRRGRHPPGPGAELRRPRLGQLHQQRCPGHDRRRLAADHELRTVRTSPVRSPPPATGSASSGSPRASGSRR